MNPFLIFYIGGFVFFGFAVLPICLLHERKIPFEHIIFLWIFFALIVGILGWLEGENKIGPFLLFFILVLVLGSIFLLVERQNPFKHISLLSLWILFALFMGILSWLKSYCWDVMLRGR